MITQHSAVTDPASLPCWEALPAPASAEGGSSRHFFWQNARAISRARLILALGNVLVVYLDPALPVRPDWPTLLATYGNVLLMIAYAVWVWRWEESDRPPAYLPTLATCLDVLFSATLIASTGAHRTPFFMWNVFTIVACAMKYDRRTVVLVSLVETMLYVAICAPHLGQPNFILGTFIVRTSYLFVIAVVLAFMGQRLLEQNRLLSRLQRAIQHLSAGRSTPDILGRVADSLTEMLEVEQVAVLAPCSEPRAIPPRLVNLDRHQGEALVKAARSLISPLPGRASASTFHSNDVERDLRLAPAVGALGGIRSLLVARLPGASASPGILVAANRVGGRGFTPADRELIELLAAQAGPLLETARLQEQRRFDAGADERRRIAAELHDRLIQTLAGMDLRLVSCQETVQRRDWEQVKEEVDMLKRLAEEALQEARGAISELAPVRLREEGLRVYLEDGVRQFQERASLPVDATIHLAAIDVPEPTALLLIGLLREGLNNVRKHASATRVTLAIHQEGDAIQFRLTDDGVGFAADQGPLRNAPTRHYGLAYLRERIAAIGGTLEIRSRPGHGATLKAHVPILTEERLVSLYSRAEA